MSDTQYTTQKEQTDGSYYYEVHVPEGVTPTSIHVFTTGAHGYPANGDFLTENDLSSDTIYIILPAYAEEKAQMSAKEYAKMIEKLAIQYNIAPESISVAGYSMGSNVAASTFACLVEDGYNIPFYIHISANSSTVTREAYKRVAEVYKDSDYAPPFIYFSDNTNERNRNLSWANECWPGDIIEFYNREGRHNSQLAYLQNNLLDFLSGKSDLTNFDAFELVTVYKKNADGTRTPVTFTTLEEFEAYFLKFRSFLSPSLALFSLKNDDSIALKSDPASLQDYINNIKYVIKSSSIQDQNVNSTYESTTEIPSKVSEIIKMYIGATKLLLGKITCDLYWIENVSDNISSMDEYLQKLLDDVKEANVIPEATTNTADTPLPSGFGGVQREEVL